MELKSSKVPLCCFKWYLGLKSRNSGGTLFHDPLKRECHSVIVLGSGLVVGNVVSELWNVPAFNPSCSCSVWRLLVLSVLACVFFGTLVSSHSLKTCKSGCLVNPNCPRVWAFVVVHFHVALLWTADLSRGYPCLLPRESWDRLQPTLMILNSG